MPRPSHTPTTSTTSTCGNYETRACSTSDTGFGDEEKADAINQELQDTGNRR